MTRFELEGAGRWRERSEGDGEIHDFVWLVTDSNNFGIWVGDSARVVLLLGHTVDHILLVVQSVSLTRLVHRTNNVGLVILPRQVALIDINDVIGVVNPEYGIGHVPVDIVNHL